MLLSLRKSFNAKNLTFQTVEDGFKELEKSVGGHGNQPAGMVTLVSDDRKPAIGGSVTLSLGKSVT